MQFTKILTFVVILTAMLNLSGAATTVSLTGGCLPAQANESTSYIAFNLANTGNGTATNLLVMPMLNGASTYNSVKNLSLIGPGNNATFKFYLHNFSLPGSYAEGFIVQYMQTGVTGFAVFPCMLNIGQQTTSQVSITRMRFSNGNLTATIFKLGGTTADVNVSVLAPPDFGISPKMRSISIQPGSFTNTTFRVLLPQNTQFVNASYSIAVMLSYTDSGLHYASYSTTVVSQNNGGGSSNFQLGNLLYVAMAAAVIAVIALIIASVIINKRRQSTGKQLIK